MKKWTPNDIETSVENEFSKNNHPAMQKLLILAVAFLVIGCASTSNTDSTVDESTQNSELTIPVITPSTSQPVETIEATPEEEESPPKISKPSPVTFNVTAKKWSFEPAVITVKKNQPVTLNVTSIDVTHGFAITDFGVNTKLIPGQTTTVEFTPDKTGSFTFFCSVQCGSGHRTMTGTLIVE